VSSAKPGRRFAREASQSISGKKFSTTPSDPARNFSSDPCLIARNHHAGENDLL
jgi:hypothetical protein